MTDSIPDMGPRLTTSVVRSADPTTAPDGLLSDDWSRPAAGLSDLNGAPVVAVPHDPRAVAYTREDCSGGNSTARQIAGIQAYAAVTGLRVEAVYSDLGASGMSRDFRPLFRAMMETARAGGCAHVVVEDLDRLGRSLPDIVEIYEELCSRGIELHDTRHGRLHLAEVVVTGYLGVEGRARFAHLCTEGRRQAATASDAARTPLRGHRKR